jgi:hypothetical protein
LSLFQLAEINEKLKQESDQNMRLRKQVSEVTFLMTTKEQSLTEKLSHLHDVKSSLELEIAKLSASLEKEESGCHQAQEQKVELEKRNMAIQMELEKAQERENRLICDSKDLLDKLVESEKSSTSLEHQLKVLSAKYEQEVKAIHKEMERRSPSAEKEDQVKGNLFDSSFHFLCKFAFLRFLTYRNTNGLYLYVLTRPYYELLIFNEARRNTVAAVSFRFDARLQFQLNTKKSGAETIICGINFRQDPGDCLA